MFFMKLGHMPSLSACIIKNNSVVWSNGYGFYDLKNKKEASADTIYMAGSISKSFTATALMQLYEQGLSYMEEKKVLGFIPNAKYDKALEAFQRIVDDYPYSEIIPLF